MEVGYAYHLGELSNGLLGHQEDDSLNQDSPASFNYQQWADALFRNETLPRGVVYQFLLELDQRRLAELSSRQPPLWGSLPAVESVSSSSSRRSTRL